MTTIRERKAEGKELAVDFPAPKGVDFWKFIWYHSPRKKLKESEGCTMRVSENGFSAEYCMLTSVCAV